MTVWSIAPATPGDGPEISDLLLRSFSALLAPVYDPAVLATALPKITQARRSLLSCPTYFVARQGGAVWSVWATGPMSRPLGGPVLPGLGTFGMWLVILNICVKGWRERSCSIA